MRRILIVLVIFSLTFAANAQELNATVTVDAQQTTQPDNQVFKTLETQLSEFLNNTQWTNKTFKNQERIDCNFTVIITNFETDAFSGSLQIQASRPIYGSSYDSPIYNYNDKQLSFGYKEFEPLNFNINTFDSNLISVLAFHVYTIIGLDADTFEPNGGVAYFETAKQIVNTAASFNFPGWNATDGTQSRFRYNDALISNVYKEFHTAMYEYHRKGMDLMHINQKTAKNEIITAIETLKSINDRRPNSYLLRTFFDAKSDEIEAVFTGGPSVTITKLVDNLNRMAPTKRSNWSSIKF